MGNKKLIKKIAFAAFCIIVLVPVLFYGYKVLTLRQAEKNVGTIDIDVMIYEGADAGITDIQALKISKMYYMQDLILEEIQESDTLKYSLFNKKEYTPFTVDLDSLKILPSLEISSKNIGAVGLGDTIPNYKNRIALNDTILDEIEYKRFAVRNPNEYTVFYVQNNLNIPYSFNRLAEKDYKGTISRIDTYKIEEDVFLSITLKAERTIKKRYFNSLKNNYFKFSNL
jgi:hypothetical protein